MQVDNNGYLFSDPAFYLNNNGQSFSKKSLKKKIAALRKQLIKRKQILNKLDSYNPQANYYGSGGLSGMQQAYLSNNQLTIQQLQKILVESEENQNNMMASGD